MHSLTRHIGPVRAREREDTYAALLSRACSPEAEALVAHVVALTSGWEQQQGRTYIRRGAQAEKYTQTAERFVGDLLRAEAVETCSGNIYRSMHAASFSGGEPSYRTFKALTKATDALGLVKHTAGQGSFGQGFDGKFQRKGVAARFTASPLLLRLAEQHGVTTGSIDTHFRLEPPREVLLLRSAKVAEGDQALSHTVALPGTARARRMASQVKRLNTFLGSVRIEGGVHYGYRRIFNEGDKTLRRGGRLYSHGGTSYQAMENKTSGARLRMRLNGMPVIEIDVRACNLTLLHAVLGVPFDTRQDPYCDVEHDGQEFHRDIVKAYVTASIGKGKAVVQWPSTVDAGLLAMHGEPDARRVRSAVLKRHPAFKRVGQPRVTWSELMYLESEAVVGTMLELMRHNVPALSVHDAILVPASKAALSTQVFAENFKDIAGVYPTLRGSSLEHSAVEAVELVMRDLLQPPPTTSLPGGH